MKYLAKVWTSALTFGALMLAGSSAASAHRVNNNQHLNNPQSNHQTSTKIVNPNQKNKPQRNNVYPLYHFRNDQNQFRLGSISMPRRHARHYVMRKQLNQFKISHHHYLARRNSSHSKADKVARRFVKPLKVNKSAVKPVKQSVNESVNAQNDRSNHFANSKLAKLANTKLGDPYVWGATGANAFDCSGFTQYLYKNAKHVILPRTAQAQYDYEKHVSYNNVKPGNLVFFGYAPSAISHVGMYVGNGKMIDAQNRGVVVENVLAPWWNLVGCAKVFD